MTEAFKNHKKNIAAARDEIDSAINIGETTADVQNKLVAGKKLIVEIDKAIQGFDSLEKIHKLVRKGAHSEL